MSWWRPIKLVLWMAGFLIVTANTAFAAHFLDRIYPGVKVADVNVGGLRRQEAKARLAERLHGYNLVIQLEDQRYQLAPNQLGLDYDLEATLELAFNAGRSSYPPLSGVVESRRTANLHYAYEVDQAKLASFVDQLSASHAQAPVDAAVVMVNGQPQAQPDKPGVGVDSRQLINLVQSALEDQSTSITISRTVAPAEIKTADLTATMDAARKLVAMHLELTYADKTFVPSAKTIGEWLSFKKVDGQLKTEVDRGKMEPYLKTVAAAIYVAPKNHLINVQNGVTTGEEPGVEGLAIDQNALAAGMLAILNSGAGNKVTINASPVPFKTVYNRTINLDFGRYIEINLSSQHLWAYQDHKVVYESAITSGATGAGFATVTGLFDIYSKERDRNLNGRAIGYNYNVFVQYWMPFSGNYGMHDASWRSSFGGPDYYYGGSHGCVNMPLETAAWIYNWADIGTPVWVHT